MARRAILARATASIQASAINNAPYDTGTLRRSISQDIRQDYGKVGSNMPYARIQEYGGTIVPKRAKFLAWQKNGRWYRAKKVILKARPYLIPAFEKTKRELGGIIDRELEKTTK